MPLQLKGASVTAVAAPRVFACLAACLPLTVVGLGVLTVKANAADAPLRRRVGIRPAREGDILHLFDGGRIYIVTNDDVALADALLEGCSQKERRVLTLDEWRKTPHDVGFFVSTVFLINRQTLPAGEAVPEACPADVDEVFTQVTRTGHPHGVTYQVTLSAPDSAWLRASVSDFRHLSEPPRSPLKRNVRSRAIVGFGPAAPGAAAPLLSAASTNVRSHLLTPAGWLAADAARRLETTDEVILIDRSAIAPDEPNVARLCAGRSIAPNDTLTWREHKPEGGHSRVVFSAPNADLLAEAVRRYPDPLQVPETATVLMTARDLRSVRRIAVVGVRNGAGGAELATRLASRAATDLRAMDSFEVLERAGLSEILGEIALGQAGITQAKDRARVRQMAAADALLVVELTDAGGRTELSATHQRSTPPIGGPPRRPAEPSRLKYDISIPGKENDPVARSVMDAALGRVVGTKTDHEFKEALNRYNRTTLPEWQREVDNYTYNRDRRPISWTEKVVAHSTATVSGSLRLVDLADGLVLWESPFTMTRREDAPHASRTVTTYGEDSTPSAEDTLAPEDNVPNELLNQTAQAALEEGIQSLRGTALLPTGRSTAASFGTTVVGTPDAPVHGGAGRLLDVDGDIVLIGLGQTDGLRPGDTLVIRLEDGQSVRVTATRVRPRTCDATFAKNTSPALQAKVTVGMSATQEER